jgi:hypothetical protein
MAPRSPSNPRSRRQPGTCLRDRRLLPPHPGLARHHQHESQPGARRARAARVEHDGVADLSRLIHHHDAGQYISIAFTERLAEAGIDPSVGSVGDAYDALAETVIGLFTTELIKPRGPWRTVEQVEIATLECLDWLNPPPPLPSLRRHPTRRTRGCPLPSTSRPHRGRPPISTSLRTCRASVTDLRLADVDVN